MQTLTLQEEGACVGTEMSGGQSLPICRTGNLNPPRLTSRRSQPPLPLRLQSTPRVGGGSAFYVRLLDHMSQHSTIKMRLLHTGIFALVGMATLLLQGCYPWSEQEHESGAYHGRLLDAETGL